MNNLVKYIHDTAMGRATEWHSYDEVIQGMYIVIASSIRDHCDTLIVTRKQIKGQHDGTTVEYLDIDKHERDCETGISNCTSYREALALIMVNDERLRQHLQLVEDTPEAVTYRIMASEQ